MRRTTIFAVLASALLLVSVAAPAVAAEGGSLSVSVSQADSGEATVSVTDEQNNSTVAVANASVTVETVDENATYDGTGEYTTDENGTVSLAAPNETVDVSVTASADNQTASTTATLEAATEDDGNESDDGNATAFGQQVSSFVHALQSDDLTNGSENGSALAQADDAENLGVVVATFVMANNPGNQPDHAGPPAWLVDDSVEKDNGPPDHAGPDGDEKGGPPDDKGNDKDKNKDKGGPPDHAGQDDGDDDEDEDDSDE